ncbi:hypothetical protein [Herpetosiphon giganteus]|uniref:hypothetical protein n=1 Tax=Herpetosiphon giganteus TaxID=2029754 RepID=UPI00195F08B1|nr:hypothetical protein [Herpetosiphon giganteus]MBM7842658.1 hypothetical protein [Herpetosiphon giganteus]
MQQRKVAHYIVTGLMLILGLIFGAFFVVWCGLLRFLFTEDGWTGWFLLIMAGVIAWRAIEAGRDAWDGLPSAPPSAIAALLATQFLFVVIQVHARWSGQSSGIDFLTILPHALIFGCIGLIFSLNGQFTGHLIEYADDEFLAEPASSNEHDDDDDLMYLGGA